MKAKKVFENIDFKRGQDPKKSLKIGEESGIPKLMELKRQMEEMDDDTFENANNTAEPPRTIGEKIKDMVIGIYGNLTIDPNDPDMMDPQVIEAIEEYSNKINDKIEFWDEGRFWDEFVDYD